MMHDDNLVRNIANMLDIRIGEPSQLEDMITQACDPRYTQPNLAMNLEICDFINKRLKTFPRDAAFFIARIINRGEPNAAYHALTLLDHCVKNCGYPFHLVIASKDFLNELVRRFPENPNRANAVQHRILELIQLWNSTLCVNSRYKDDFKHINDMHRLLIYKGYRFPEVVEDPSGAYNEIGGLKTEEELEEEDRKMQGVKLEELLRKGTPAALAQANDLMKVMAGFDESHKRDYKKEVNEELDRVESKVILLNDMLNQVSSLSAASAQDKSTIEEIYGHVKTAQSRIQKFIDDNDDADRVNRLLEMNDLINTVVEKYAAVKNGQAVKSNELDRRIVTDKSAGNKSESPAKGAINLIDFDDNLMPASTPVVFDPFKKTSATSASNSQKPAGGDLLNDLTGIFQPAPSNIAFGGLASKPAANSLLDTPFQQPVSSANNNGLAGLGGLGFPATVNANRPVQVPVAAPQTTGTVDLLGSFSGVSNTAPVQPPFGNLSAFPQPSASIPNLVKPSPTQYSPNSQTSPSAGSPISRDFQIFDKNGLQIKLKIKTNSSLQHFEGQVVFINVTPVPFNELNFLVAVPKSMELQLDAISSTTVVPLNQAQAIQNLTISNPSKDPLRLRFKVSYSINGAVVNESGEFAATF